MTLALVHSRAKLGIDAPSVTVEAHLANGLPALTIVGLPEAAVKEAKDRVRSAILNSHFEFPSRRITINLAPADLPKEGGRFDLPIALGILAASGQIPAEALAEYEFIGELALAGDLRPVTGVLPTALAVGQSQRTLVVPEANGAEAALSDTPSHTADHLLAVTAHLLGRRELPAAEPAPDNSAQVPLPDLREVKGQDQARRVLEIAAAGGHNLLYSGPPGAGKTLLASRLPSILPALTRSEALQVAAIHSVAGHGDALPQQRPFRAPHHTASGIALVGGGTHPKPGEISLAHQGVLFLDELPEFPRKVLEVLREPLESGEIHIARASAQVTYPARFQLVAAMNPCPCGYHGDPAGRCRCTPDQVRRYRDRLSGPLLDRIDLQLQVPPVKASDLARLPKGEASATVRARVEAARARQQRRQGCANAALEGSTLHQHCPLDDAGQALLSAAVDRLGLSARAYHRILKVARTIADLAGAEAIASDHLAEAVSYRFLDRVGQAQPA